MLLLLLLPSALGNTGRNDCQCITDWNRAEYYVSGSTTSININLGGIEYVYPADYGINNCTTHDTNLAPYCDVDSPPDWCSDMWCYVDPDNCALPTLLSSYFPEAGLRYSYSTCGSTNTFASWFGDNAASDGSHTITDIADVLEGYLIEIVDAIESNHREIRDSPPTCSIELACECGAVNGGSCELAPSWGQSIDVQKTTFWGPEEVDQGSTDARIDQCLGNIVSNTFARIAALEANVSYVGYEYYGSQTHGNYLQWPGTDWCPTTYDPRFRPWYAAAASGPKDVVVIIDSSGSMNGAAIADAREAAKKVLLTLTDADYVTVIGFAANTYSYSSTLVPATASTLADMESWIDSQVMASGTTNYRAALSAAWAAFGGTTSSSDCNKVVLFLTDGQPDAWDSNDYSDVRAATRDLDGVHLLTYALGQGLDNDAIARLKTLACENDGVAYRISDSSQLASTMAQYYEVLSPMIGPCQPRWIEYSDWITGDTLIAQCLAAHEMLDGAEATSCQGGLDGIGDDGDSTVPSLLGVACVDLNLLVNIDTIQARIDWPDFESRILQERRACGRHALNSAQLETLRAQVSADAVCDADAYYTSNGNGDEQGSESSPDGVPIGTIIVIAVAIVTAGMVCCAFIMRSSSKPARAQASARPQSSVSTVSSASAAAPPVAVATAVAVPMAQASTVQSVPVGQPVGSWGF